MATEGVIRRLTTLWGFDVDAKQLDQAEKKLEGVKKSAESIGKTVTAAGLGLFGLAAFTAHASDEAEDTAEALGMTVRELRRLQVGATLAGVDMDRFTMGLSFMKRQASEASNGNMETAMTFARLGVSMRTIRTASTTELLSKLSVGLTKVKNQNDRLRISNELFGRGNAKMLLLLQKGPAALAKYTAEAEKMGLVMSKKDSEAAAEFYKNMLRVKMVMTSLRNVAGSYLIPMFNDLAISFMQWVKANKELIKLRIHQALDAIVGAIRGLFAIGRAVLPVIKQIVASLGGMEKVVKLVVYGFMAFKIGSLVADLWKLSSAIIGVGKAVFSFVMQNPESWPIIAGIAMIGILIDDVVAFVQGRKSVIGVVWKSIKFIIDSIREGFKDIADEMTRMMEKVPALKSVLDFVRGGKLNAEGKMTYENLSPGQKGAVDWLESARLSMRNMLGVQAPFQSVHGGMMGGGAVINYAPNNVFNVLGGSAPGATGEHVRRVVKEEQDKAHRQLLRDAQNGIQY